MYGKRKFKAFSMVELMLLLLISSLIIAATVPLVTKRHMRIPGSVSHGTYICYYRNGVLHETRWSGKATQRKVFDRNAIGGDCVFDPPKKATYFQISAIGGGGGGGDAGYTGGNLTEKLDTTTKIPPLGLTEARADALGLRDKDAGAADPWKDAKDAAGTLWAFAKSLPSGNGGSVGYMEHAGTKDGPTCLEYEEYCKKTATDVHSAKKYHCVRTIEIDGGQSSNIIRDIFARLKFVNKIASYVKGVMTGAATTTTTEGCGSWFEYTTVRKEKYTVDVNPHEVRYSCCPSGYEEVVLEPAHDEWVDVDCSTRKWVSFGGGGGESSAAQSSSGAGTWVVEPCTRKEKVRVPAVKVNRCKDGDNYTCTKTVYDKEERIRELPPESHHTTIPSCRGDANVECYEVGYSDADEICVETAQRCVAWEQFDIFSHTIAAGASGGAGATCSTNGVSHKLLNLGYTADKIAAATIEDGTSYDMEANGREYPYQTPQSGTYGFASCGDGTISNTSTGCGSLEAASYSQATITDGGTSHTTRAYSAWRGGQGASRKLTPTKMPTPPLEDMYWNLEGDTPLAGANGGCAGSPYEPGTLGDCGSSDMVGYCLRHKTANGSEINEPNGQYDYKRIFDENFLTKGNPGYAGQFHTVIVRSLDSVDRTIHIGRGGSPATLNLGGSGADGSPTYMGADPNNAIIKADGGKGGEGYQMSILRRQLPRFILPKWKAEKLCYKKLRGGTLTASETSELNTNLAAAGMGSCPSKVEDLVYIKPVGGEAGGVSSTTTFGGMFNFMKLSFNSDGVINDLIQHAGKGGAGGGVTHYCWAGQDRIWLNDIWHDAAYLPGPSVNRAFVQSQGCYTDYENHVAGPGSDGALIIRW